MNTTSFNVESFKNELGQFYGTEGYQRFGRILLTDGVTFLATKGECFWLLNIVTSILHLPEIKKEEFITIKFTRTPNTDGGTFVAEDGNGNVLYTQDIEYTDFPLDTITLFLTDNVLMLPSEY